MKIRIGRMTRSGMMGPVALCLGTLSPQIQAATTATMESPAAPSGFSNASSSVAPVYQGGGLLEGLTIISSLSGYYDTNVTRSPGGGLAPVEDDFILSPGFGLGYLSKASTWTFGGNYHGRYDEYFNHSSFSGYNQGGGVAVNYDGRRLSATLNAGMDINRGVNAYYASAFIEQTNYHTGLTARYRLSPKTFLDGYLNESYNTASGGHYANTQSFDTGLSALWKYSALTEFGPGLRYAYRVGGGNIALTSISPTLSLNYKLSTKVSLNSRVGVDFSSYSTGSTADPGVSALLGLNYQASKLWGMNFSLYRDSLADPSAVGRFIEVTSARLGYTHKLHRATLNAGIGYQMNNYSAPGVTTAAHSLDVLTFDASLGMPIFANKCDASVFARYNDQSGSTTNTWSGFQTGISISHKF